MVVRDPLDRAPWDDEPLTEEDEADIRRGVRDLRAGRFHTLAEWWDIEADGIVCLGYANGRDGAHEHWPVRSW